MKILKIIGLSLAGLILLAVIIGFIMPAKSVCERSLEMKASPATVFEQINTLKNWDNWSPWKEMDPKMVNSYNSVASGVGAEMSWEGPDAGKGKMVVTDSKMNNYVKTDLFFGDMTPSQCTYLVEPTKTGTKLTFRMESDNGWNPFYRLMSGLFKGMLEKQFDKGMKNISDYTDKHPVASGMLKGKVDSVKEVKQEAFDYLAIHDTASVSTIGMKMEQHYGKIQEAIAKQKLEIMGAPFAIYYTESTTNFDLDIAIPVNKPGKAEGNIKPGKIKAGKALVAAYRGPYENTWMGAEAVTAYLKEHKQLSISGPMWEAYVTDPGMVPDTAQWLTNVVFPVN